MPIVECKGIGIASPKGTDPVGYRTVVHEKLHEAFGEDEALESEAEVVTA
jgi:hypothetical protein